jgi:hypothetical protein
MTTTDGGKACGEYQERERQMPYQLRWKRLAADTQRRGSLCGV